MMILARLVVAIVAFLTRYAGGLRDLGKPAKFGETDYTLSVHRDKQRVTGYTYGVKAESGIAFTMTAERAWDRFFKTSGLSHEFQTGDTAFDAKVYIACDHPAFCRALQNRQAMRKRIAASLSGGAQRIWSDGSDLYIRTGPEAAVEHWVPVLDELRAELAKLRTSLPGRLADPFVRRAVLVESAIWSIAGYAAVGFMEDATITDDYHLDPEAVGMLGMATGGVLGLALLAAIVLLMRRSSRSHRILVESAVVLALALPLAGVQLVSDVNRGLDTSAPIVIDADVIRTFTREHHSRRRTYHTYHVVLDAHDSPVKLPEQLEVGVGIYGRLWKGRQIRIELGRGRLGLYWYRSIDGTRYDPLPGSNANAPAAAGSARS